MESRISRIERSVEYLIGKVKKQSEWIHILEDKVRDLEVVNVAENKCLLSDSEKQAYEAHRNPVMNFLRKAVIDDAKRFVDSNVAEINQNTYIFLNEPFSCEKTPVKFVVNQQKQTVVALLKGVTTGMIRGKGIAKCNPDDVFNEDIGKAIALGRALGKDVSKFEDAVQPDTVVVDMVVKSTNLGNIHKVEGFYSYEMLDGEYGRAFYAYGFTKPQWIGEKQVVILDDTDAKYEFN